MNMVEKYWNSNVLKLRQKFPVSFENLRKTMQENKDKRQNENGNEFDEQTWQENLEYSETICKEKEKRYNISWPRMKAPRLGSFAVLSKKYHQDSDSLEYDSSSTASRFKLQRWKSDCYLNENFDEQIQVFRSCPSERETVTFCEHNIVLKSALMQKKGPEIKRKTKAVRFSVYALLLSAASQNAAEELKQLIRKYPEYINRHSSSGNTVLHTAVICGHLDCVRLLVEHGANVLIQNFEGQTPLSLAWKYDYNDCLNFMLKASGKFVCE